MSNLATKTVGEIASLNPSATRIFEGLKIDYCCGGTQTLETACASAGLNVEEVSQSLEQAALASGASKLTENRTHQPLSILIEHILMTHHVFTKEELARLDPLMAKVCSVHGKNHPELHEVHTLFQGLAMELAMHLRKEEEVLFPFIVQMEKSVTLGNSIPVPPFGTIQNPIRMMEREHEGAGDVLARLRTMSGNYTVPPDGCASFQTLYQALQDLEADLHQHIHLENNILFTRAIRMESGE